MINKCIAIYVFIDDLLKETNHNEPTNRNMSDAEIVTTVLVSAIYFSGHHEKAMSFMSSTGLITHMLSKSRFNRRLHQIRDLIVDLFFRLSALVKELNISSEYTIDIFPISTCDNSRIANLKLVQGEIYRGKKVSMRRYFYGYNIHLFCSETDLYRNELVYTFSACFYMLWHKKPPAFTGGLTEQSHSGLPENNSHLDNLPCSHKIL